MVPRGRQALIASTAQPDAGRLKPAKSLIRAMSIARLIAGGMDHGDAHELHAAARSRDAWDRAAERLGDRNLARAHHALAGGHPHVARNRLLLASACFRFAQVPLVDADPRKRELYGRMRGAFGHAGELAVPAVERVEIPWRHGSLFGWLIRGRRRSPHPFVISLGGVDAWCEEFEPSARHLRARGVTTLLADGPGQGESRLFGGLHLDEHVVDALRRFVDAALGDRRCDGRVGLWGNSAGGWLATRLAASDDRIAACAINGGTDRPTEILDRFPRFVDQFQLLTGRSEPEDARRVLDDLAVDRDLLTRVTCPLHVVHGTPDRIFLVESARRIHAHAASRDKTLSEFPDGDHCIANRSSEMQALLAGWLADRLGARGA